MADSFAMLSGLLRPASAGVPGRAVPVWAANALIAATLLLCTVHTTPFVDLSSPATIEVWEGGNLLTQIAYSALFLAALALVARIGIARLKPLAGPLEALLVAWIGVSTLLAQAPANSMRRLALTFICIFLAAALLLVARSVRQFARSLALTALGVLVLSYLSVVVAPRYAMHTTLDLKEPDLAGNWRGPFNHKNEAGAIMVLFVFVGLLAWNTGQRLLGGAVAGLAALFLVFTHSKTATALLPLILLQIWLAQRFRGSLWRGLVLLGPVALLGLVSLGSFFFRPLQELIAGALTDTSFTGRTEIWEFALDNILKHPVAGWGYGGFWRTEETQYGSWGTQTWLAETSQAHNAYLDTALFMGLPGLALTLLVFVARPLRDLQRAEGGRRMDPATVFFVSLWLYALMTGFFESVFYEGNSAIFLLFVLALFGLRFRTLAPAVAR
ncbi:O-antigen ligase family protein [Methylobacterium organophilum]|uniref:O-antigen ligase-related domain-containing protein n=1 Tax=Methylobacterium organophilum TaxID=410 RepID=A0ABQ4T6X2_METOR|nr:O-antigen ligase [Methylobacterium organophilum]GJE26771.1 hypothetical protein LKMONMHP_1622 [Methylobacterium organophilum]